MAPRKRDGRGADAPSFTSAALVALVYRTLEREDPSLVPRGFDPLALAARGRTGIEIKRTLLEHAHARAGPGPLLRIGRTLSAMREHPTVAVLVRTPDTDVLADKWRRLERYHHSDHRTAIDTSAPGRWICHHTSRTGTEPLPSEHALLCGLLIGLIEMVGGRGVRWRAAGVATPVSANEVAGPHGPGERFELHGFANTRRRAPFDTAFPADSGTDRRAVAGALIDADISRHWHLGELARHLHVSSRSLQRSLASSGTSFSRLVQERRTQESARLLRDTDRALVDIGFECGFADQAHFQRTFSRCVGMTPDTYRRLSRE